MRFGCWSLMVVAALLQSSCMVGPDFRKPDPILPKRWSATRQADVPLASASPDELARWWTQFKDPLLDRLIAEARQQNPDLQMAFARIDQARAEQSATRSDLYPTVSGTGKVAKVANLLPFETPLNGNSFNYFLTGFDTFWEIDVVGRLRRKLEAAEAETRGSAEEHRQAFIVLAAEIGRQYTLYRGQQHQQSRVLSQLKRLATVAELQQFRVDQGLDTSVELARTRAELDNLKAQQKGLAAELVTTRHDLEELIGKPPNALLAKLSPEGPIPSADAQRLLTTPALTLALRPDVRAAEQALQAATARQGAALAELFPKVSIAAFIGLRNSDLENLFRSSSFAWASGSSLSQPLFNFGQIRAGIHLADARQREALAAFEKTVNQALHECESAFSEYLQDLQRKTDVQAAVLALESAARLADERVQQGLETRQQALRAWLAVDEQRSRLIEIETSLAIRLIALYKAIGGGDGELEPPVLEEPLRPWG